jgi:hypothetical protein
MRSALLVALVTACLVSAPLAARAEDSVGVFRLDGLSFVSFGDQQFLFPESGSTLTFRFGTPAEDDSVSFRILPEDVALAPIPLPSGQGTLRYTLAAPASDFLRPSEGGGRVLEFNAAVAATLDAPEGRGTYTYGIPFTTENASAPNAQHTDTVSVSGMRLVDGVWYAQIVGATTNKENAYPAPGAAVYTVLSGRFDRVP